jgi:hypothetical protein
MFQNITLGVYQAARRLFCTSLFRTDRTVWQILEAWAREANTVPPSAEAVWAICEYLRADRDEQFTPHIERAVTRWQIDVVKPNAIIQDNANALTEPKFVCVVSNTPEHVLAFRRYEGDTPPKQVIAQTLYDALTSQRQPEQLVPNGLTWPVPASIESTIPLPDDVQVCCATLNLPIEGITSTTAIIRDLEGAWTRSLTGRTLAAERFEAIFDNYLEKRHGHGPRKARDDADYAYRHLDGYNRDPALVLPALRYLLPIKQATVRDGATIAVAGREYTDPLLISWRGQPVEVRISRHDPSQVYVYLNGAILCQAQEAVESPELELPDLFPDRSI